MQFLFYFILFFFGRRRLKKRSEKTEIARSKRRHRKGGGQAAAKKRSPLRRMWNRGRARSAKVHACGAQLKGEFQEISRECEGCLKIKDARAGALEAPYGCWRTAAEEWKKPFTDFCSDFEEILSEFRRITLFKQILKPNILQKC